MQLIKKVEVNYFRSLYSANLDNLGDLNVVFGRNDSGKSNLLRALHLFFNEAPEPQRDFDFALDMSDIRRREARDRKGKQFIWIRVTFNVPANYRSSLGDWISVKRQWNREGDWNQTVSSSLGDGYKQARLTRFLNDIDFTYIPAVKDLTVYADLIERMYGAAAETEAIRTATNAFVAAIGQQTEDLSNQLQSLFSAPARLAAPTEMESLFRNLDFAHGDDEHSLLRQKGDGVKARHLPEIVRFINERDPRAKLYLWGFEEPENSLDLSAAESEARRFAAFSNRPDTQIFITSHSPAFYLAEGTTTGETRRYFISKQVAQNGEVHPTNAASNIDSLSDAEARMQHAGLLQLPYIIRHLQEQRSKLDAVEEEADALRSTVVQMTKPTIFVEGVHDRDMIELSLQRHGLDGDIAVKPLGGTPKTAEALLASVLEQGGISPSSRTLFLFDDDKAGRGAYRKLTQSSSLNAPTKYGDNLYCWLIQKTDELRKFAKRHGVLAEQSFFTAEFLYPTAITAPLVRELTSDSDDDEIISWRETIHGDYWPGLGQKRCQALLQAEAGSPDWLYARGVPDTLKTVFATEMISRGVSTHAIDGITAIAAAALRS